jgi:Phosphotransferase enzyme family
MDERDAERVDERIPDEVLASVTGRPDARLVSCRAEPVTGSSGAATGGISLLTGIARAGTADVPFRVVRKTVRPVTTGRHAPYAGDPAHWAYWRREPLAYASGLLPVGPGLAAPRCHGVVGDVIYLAPAAGKPESAEIAARRLGAWQAATATPDAAWLARDQLRQRVEASDLDWRQVSADPRLAAIWARRAELLGALDRVPRVLVHGDFSAGNLIAADERTTVVLDWATLGTGPVGADLASLALSAEADAAGDPLPAYLAGLDGRFARADVELGYRATLALTGASRVHWMLSRGTQPPPGYVEFVAAQAC